jgi:ATP-dependent Lhr-like helicase
MGSKRGVQTELCLARLRSWRPALRTWGISATLGNLEQALAVLTGADAAGLPRPGRLVRGLAPKEIMVDSILPESMARFPWAGHLGLKLLDQVADAIDEGRTTLVFTNTRSQTESWYSALLGRRPDWAGEIALHHGSLASETREWVEAGLKAGELRCVVCTASLDLGVDFPTVERVLQIGSPKGVARLLQRAGRSGHQPGVTSRVTCVPTHALELVEVAAVRRALAAGQIEARTPPEKPLDLLVQHLVTLALGGGFTRAELGPELRSAWSYRTLSDAEIEWTLDFVVAGGAALGAYAEYRRVELLNGRYVVTDKQVATRHRMSIGTIVGDQQLEVRYLRGSALGFVTESFISRLTPGNKFLFAGKVLEFVRLREMTAWVKPASSLVGAIPRWTGTSLPISQELGAALRAQLAEAAAGELNGPEMQAVAPILRLQAKWSRIPGEGEWLIEKVKSREGHHLFFYTFAGKLVNSFARSPLR